MPKAGGYPTAYRSGSRGFQPTTLPGSQRYFQAPRPATMPKISFGEITGYQAGPKPAPGLKPSPALQKKILRGLLLAQTGRRLALLGDLVELGEFYVTELPGIIYDHPADAELLEKCEDRAVQVGPHKLDGDCAVINQNSQSFYEGQFGFITDGFGDTHWRYHEDFGVHAGVQHWGKAERWRSLSGGQPGALAETQLQVQALPEALPQVQVKTAVDGAAGQRTSTRLRNPTRRPDERKKGRAQRGFALAAHVYGTADEAREFVDVLHDCISAGCRTKGLKGTLAKAMDFWRCAGTLDLGCFAVGFLVNQLEDRVIGTAQGKASKATRGLRGGVGSAITGPAL